MEQIVPRKFRITRHIAECPRCGTRYVWINQDLVAKERTCKRCKFAADGASWPTEEDGDILITVTDEMVIVEEED